MKYSLKFEQTNIFVSVQHICKLLNKSNYILPQYENTLLTLLR